VVVTDGFVGNVSLKTSEGLATLFSHVLQAEFKRSWLTRLAAIFALPVLNAVRRKLDHRRYNGASLLGLNGIVIKSHGSADVSSYLNAIRIASIEVDKDVPQRISSIIESHFREAQEAVT
jgi:glycerol-3-phosphate acyltransferase PlsX